MEPKYTTSSSSSSSTDDDDPWTKKSSKVPPTKSKSTHLLSVGRDLSAQGDLKLTQKTRGSTTQNNVCSITGGSIHLTGNSSFNPVQNIQNGDTHIRRQTVKNFVPQPRYQQQQPVAEINLDGRKQNKEMTDTGSPQKYKGTKISRDCGENLENLNRNAAIRQKFLAEFEPNDGSKVKTISNETLIQAIQSLGEGGLEQLLRPIITKLIKNTTSVGLLQSFLYQEGTLSLVEVEKLRGLREYAQKEQIFATILKKEDTRQLIEGLEESENTHIIRLIRDTLRNYFTDDVDTL